MAIALLLIIGILIVKYKPVYKVIVNGTEIGYIENKEKIEERINEYVNTKEDCVAFKTLKAEPNYEVAFVANAEVSNEETIVNTIIEDAQTTYTMYGITINGDIKTYVKTEEEADTIVNELKEEYKEQLELNIAVKQIYTREAVETVESNVAMASLKENTIDTLVENKKKEEQKANGITVVDGIVLANKPIDTSITITSRYGVRSSIRSGAHTGLDLATKSGTPIKVTTDGTVTFSGYSGAYGNLVKVSHGEGVETWYGHCSKLYVTKGEKVEAGDVIAAVGSTGNSTGPHLHFEIRINGNTVNPQKYIYK